MELAESVIKTYDSNQVASNNPLEDRRSEASCLFTNGNFAHFLQFIIIFCLKYIQMFVSIDCRHIVWCV